MIEIEQEDDKRFLAEVIGFPGVLAYGNNTEEVVARVQTLALRVLEETNRQGAESAEKEESGYFSSVR
jgi:predicted RNase H-like HicB family nuclease